MKTTELRKEITDYINQADERFLRLVYSMVESEMSEDAIFNSTDTDMRKRAETSLHSAETGNTRNIRSFQKEVDSWKQKKIYEVAITPEAEQFFYEILEYLYKHHSDAVAAKKSDELLAKTLLLEHSPLSGKKEPILRYLGKNHRYILHYYTARKAIKILYFIDEVSNTVYVTDFFPCMCNPKKQHSRQLRGPAEL